MTETLTKRKVGKEVKKGRLYLIQEKPIVGSTPPELVKEGRAKMVMGAKEYAGCTWDDRSKSYDTGLHKNSKQFIGMDKEEVAKILEDRKELIEYFNDAVERYSHDPKEPFSQEAQFVANHKLLMYHNRLVDTSSPEEWMRLHLAMQGTDLTPESEIGNLGKYGRSMYVLVDSEEKRDINKEFNADKMAAVKWLLKTLETDQNKVYEVFRYHGILQIGQTKEDSVLMDTLSKKMESKEGYEFLKEFLYTITKTPDNEVYAHNKLVKLQRQGKVRLNKGSYYFEDIELGKNLKAAVKFLLNKENAEVAARLFK